MYKIKLNSLNRSLVLPFIFNSLCVLILAHSISGCSKDDDEFIPITNLSLNKVTLILPVGGIENLMATITPIDATDKTISWKSSNITVATVDDKGKVIANAPGTATITAIVGSKTAICTVTVSQNVIPVSEISLNKNTLTLMIDEEQTLTATVTPVDAPDKTVTWASSNTQIATVSSAGKVKAIAVGTATITAIAGNKTAVCTVTVTENGSSSGQTDRFRWALYGIKYSIHASTEYNDNGKKPKSFGTGGCSYVFYSTNGSMDHMTVDLYYNLKIDKKMTIPFRFDVGKRPAAMCFVESSSVASNTATELKEGTYDFVNDPAEVLAYFGGYTGNSKFTSLSDLRKIVNNPGITEAVYNSISFAVNCYKIIIYEKNSSGKLIGKYIGYVFNEVYFYWCIDPEDKDFGKSFTVVFP